MDAMVPIFHQDLGPPASGWVNVYRDGSLQTTGGVYPTREEAVALAKGLGDRLLYRIKVTLK